MNTRETQQIIGAQMRELRRAKHLTLAQLAAQTGLSVGYLSQLEREDAAPSVQALSAIGAALGVGINWFFPDPKVADDPNHDVVVRHSARRTLRFADGVRDELLSPSLAGTLELILTTFQPGASSGDALYAHRGEEGGYVSSGQLDITLDDRVISLGAGDAFQFASTRPHRYFNPGPSETVLFWVVTPPHY